MQNSSSVIVIDENPASREIIQSFLESMDFIGEISLAVNYEQGLEEVKSNPQAIVIMDISNHEYISDELKLYTSRLIVTSTNYSTNTIVQAMRHGAKDFLPKPILKDDLQRALKNIINTETNETSMSKIITIYSNKGGIGKTTIAVNLASELAKITKDKVALVDLNLQLGDISTFLNLSPAFDVSYVIRKIINKEEDVILKVFEKYKETSLYILSDPNYIEQSESITPQQIVELFKVLKKVFPYIVVDMSSSIDPNTLKILDCSDWVLFTSIVNIPAIRNAQRCLNLFRSRRYPKDKVKIIINRYMENDEIKITDIENTLGERIYWKIPNNYFTIMEAINKGVTVSEINISSNISSNFKEFASKVSNDIIEQAVVKYKI